MKRTTKFYRKNEEEVMKSLGLKPTKNSGSGWIEKEDGQNDFVICQLKSTDAQSIKVNQKDIRVLEKNALVSHKLPLFAIQFLNTGEIWLMAKPVDFVNISEYIKTGEVIKPSIYDVLINDTEEEDENIQKKKIKSSENARNSFNEQRKKMFDKTRSAK